MTVSRYSTAAPSRPAEVKDVKDVWSFVSAACFIHRIIHKGMKTKSFSSSFFSRKRRSHGNKQVVFPEKAPFSIGDAFRFYPTNKESEKTGGKANTRWEINRDLGISGSAIPGTRDSKRKRDYNRLLKPNCVSLSENDIWITYRHAKQQRKREGKRERKREAIYSSETWRQLG